MGNHADLASCGRKTEGDSLLVTVRSYALEDAVSCKDPQLIAPFVSPAATLTTRRTGGYA
jgi:hypothetical protein